MDVESIVWMGREIPYEIVNQLVFDKIFECQSDLQLPPKKFMTFICIIVFGIYTKFFECIGIIFTRTYEIEPKNPT